MKKWLVARYVKIVTWFKERQNEGTGYVIPLKDLIIRAENRFKFATNYDQPYCPQCMAQDETRVPMMFRHSKIVVGVPNRDDQGWKCPVCYTTVHHGIPITREAALDEIKLRGNAAYLMRPSFRPDERDNEIVKERLRRLGYIE